MLGARGEYDRALHADEGPDGCGGGRFDLRGDIRRAGRVRAPKVLHKNSRTERAEKDDGDDKKQDRDQLGDGGNDIERGCLLHAPQNQSVEQPDDSRGTDDREQIVAVTEDREEMTDRAKQQSCIRNIAQECADPIAPSGVEADKFAEALLGIAVDPVSQIGAHAVEPEEAHHQAEHADAADGPADEDTAGMRAACSHIACRCKNTAANGRADDHGGQLGEAQRMVLCLSRILFIHQKVSFIN